MDMYSCEWYIYSMPRYSPDNRLASVAAQVTSFRAKYVSVGRALLLTHRDSRAVPMQYQPAATPLESLHLIHYDPDRSSALAKLPLPGFYCTVARTAITTAGVEVF